MRQHEYRVYFAGMLFFCWILFCAGTRTGTAEGKDKIKHQPEKICVECTKEGEDDLGSDWRYVRIYIDETSYRVVDITVVLGILMFLAVFSVVRGD